MRLTRSLLLLVTVVSCAAGAAMGCSSTEDEPTDDAGTEQPGQDSGSGDDATVQDSGSLGPIDSGRDARAEAGLSTDGGSDARVDGAVTADGGDAGRDSGVDAGNFASEGDPCKPTPTDIQERSCGRCGKEARLCGYREDAGADGGYVWFPWGGCQGEKPGGCFPGTTTNVPCGRCGVQVQVCDNLCNIGAGFCTEPPTAVCTPDAGEFKEGLSCPAGEGRRRSCQNNCTWTQYSPTCEAWTNDNVLQVTAATVGQTFEGVYVAPDAVKVEKLTTGGCPSALQGASSTSQYAYVELKNTTSQTLRLSVWAAPGAPTNAGVDTIMAAYAGAVPPADRTQCAGYVNDYVYTTDFPAPQPTDVGSGGFAGLAYNASDTNSGVTLPPNGSALVYHAVYSTSRPNGFGFTLKARVEAVQ